MGIEQFRTEKPSTKSQKGMYIKDARKNKHKEYNKVKKIANRSNDGECSICGSYTELEKHHICYKPEVTIDLCKKHHNEVHQKGKRKSLKPINKKPSKYTLPNSLLSMMCAEVESFGETYKLYEVGGYSSEKEFINDCIRDKIYEIANKNNISIANLAMAERPPFNE